MTDKTCAERVIGEMESRIAQLEALHTALDDAQDNDGQGIEVDGETLDADDIAERIDTFALGAEIRYTLVVQLSTGGPGDQFEIEIQQSRHGWEIADDSATYRFLDWFDGATATTENPTVLNYLETIAECLGGGVSND